MTDEEMFRNVAADSMAQGFIVEILLAEYLSRLPEFDRKAAVSALESSGKKTSHFAGLTKGDEKTSEVFADVVVKMHAALDGLLYRAVRRMLVDEAAKDQSEKP